MSREKLAIVSSYSELCGNASYTKALEKELANHFDVSVIALDVDLLKKGAGNRAARHIRDLRQQLKNFDCVNIQLEAGLFGSSPSVVKNNFFSIAKACKKMVITMHRYHARDQYPGILSLLHGLFKCQPMDYIRKCKQVYANNRYVPFYRRVICFCQKHEIPIIVHTKRDKKSIELEFGFDKVFDHPLCFYSQDEIFSMRSSLQKEDFYNTLNLNRDKVYIGIFGFINSYKGHETAIKSLTCLPHKYELLICGSQHPHTIQLEEPINSYIKYLLNLIEELSLTNRVKFYNLSNDLDFLRVLIHCDYNVLPYLEVMQGGSAIAALALESNSQAIFSQNCAFFELAKYAENSFKMFSIGNYMELATAITSYDSSRYEKYLNKYHEKYNIHKLGLLYRNLLNRTYLNEQVREKEFSLRNEHA